MIASVSAVSAESISITGGQVEIRDDNSIVNLNVGNCDVKTSKNVTYIQVKKGSKLSLQAVARAYDNPNLKTNGATWDFGDKTGLQSGITKTHVYKTSGWKTLKVTINASGKTNLQFLGGDYNATWYDATRTFKIYVANGPDLVATNFLKYGSDRKNAKYVTVTVKNTGNKVSPGWTKKQPRYLRIFYELKDTKKYSGLKKYTAYAKIPTIKAGKSAVIKVNFKIPYKYRNYVKRIEIDYKNKISESYKGNNIARFR